MASWRAAGVLLLCALCVLPWSCGSGPSPLERHRSADSLLRRGEFESAAKAAAAAEKYAENDPELWCRIRLIRIEALLIAGKVPEAEALLAHPPQSASPEYDVRTNVMVARRALAKSDFDSALKFIKRAEAAAQKSGRGNLEAEARIQMGILLGQQGKFEQAETNLRGALSQAEASGDVMRKASATNNLGMLRMVRSRCDEAIPLFQQAETLWEGAGADYLRVAARGNLAVCLQQVGDVDRALEIRKESLQLRRPSVLKANAFGEMGTLLLDEDPRKAVQHYRQALDMARDFGANTDAARWAGNLSLALTTLGEWDAAQQAITEAFDLRPEPRSRAFLELNQAAIALGRGRRDEAAKLYLEAIATNGGTPAILWSAHAGLANTRMAASDAKSAMKHFEAAIGIVESAWAELNANEYKITFLSSLIGFYRDYVEALMAQGQVEKALAIADRSRARVMAQRLKQNVPQMTADFRSVAGRSGSVWLSYWLAPERSFLWVITPKEIRSFTLPPAAEIEKLVREYRGFIEDNMRDPLATRSEAGRALYEKLLAPAVPFLKQDADVVIIPDGALHQLSFDALPVYSAAPHYLLNDYAIAIAPSLGVYRGSHAPKGERQALIIGDPVSPGPEFPPLPHAAAEVAIVQKRLSPMHARVVTKDAARPDVWKSVEPAKYSIIHIAAHAEANEKNPLQSAIILSPEPTPRLFAKDMIDVPLRADLVTLSACRSSGAKAYRGEGLVGFAWTFLQAGSHSVVAGLWDVADESTSMLMDRMYEGIARREAPHRALRRARMALQQTQYSKPYYWGPFQCYVR